MRTRSASPGRTARERVNTALEKIADEFGTARQLVNYKQRRHARARWAN